MKRYFIAAIFAGFIVLAIGLFLGLAAASPLPSFRLETLEGDSEEGKALLLKGIFENGPYNEIVEITAEGSVYKSEQSAYSRYRDGWIPHIPELERLLEAYPGFMRGRQHFSDEYYQDDEWLVRFRAMNEQEENGQWAGVRRFKIEMLNKKTGQKRSLAAPVPDVLNVRHVLDVQKRGDLLQAALLADPPPRGGSGEDAGLRIYQVSLEDGQVIGSGKIVSESNMLPEQSLVFYEVIVPDSTAPQKYLFLQASLVEAEQISSESASKNARLVRNTVRERQLLIYDYETGKVNTLTLPEENPEFKGSLQFYGDDSAFVRLMMTSGEIHLSRYRLPDLTPEKEIRLTPADLKAESIDKVAWGKNRLYILHRARGLPSVTALELSSGNVVYRGTVTSAEEASGQLENLHISYITFRS